MGQDQQLLRRHVVRARFHAVPFAMVTSVGLRGGEIRVLGHGVSFPSLGYEVVVVSHDGVDGNSLGAARRTQATSVPECEKFGSSELAGMAWAG